MKNIIISQNDYGIEIRRQFIDIRNKQPVDATSCVGNAFIEYPDGTKVHKSVYPINNKDGILAVMLDKEDTKDTGVHRIIMSLMNGEYYVTAQEDVYYYVK